MRKRLASLIAAGALALGLSACANWDMGPGPLYVVGRYTCVDPSTGMPDYCVEYSDGSSALVPWSIYSTIGYGYGLTYVNHSYSVVRTSYVRSGGVPDVYHVHYRTGTATYGYGGMSYRNNSGRIIYRSSTSYRSSSTRSRF